MDHYRINIFFILIEHFFHSQALVLIKYGRVYEHYLKNRESSTAIDPLGDLGLEERIQLCDHVLNAKQFSTRYPPSYQKKKIAESVVHVTKWNLPSDVPIDSLNYQRVISTGDGGKDYPLLQYHTRILRMDHIGQKISLKRIQCVRTKTICWYVTFGLMDGFMYLLERDRERGNAAYRMVGILEPSPVSDNRGFEYFQNQHEQYRDEMESICLLGFNDHTRLCSAVLDALDKLGSLTKTIGQINYVKFTTQHCRKKGIRMSGKVSQEYFLQCTFAFEDESESSSLFYALADSSERGAVFVFLEGERGRLRLHTRLVKVGALVNPIGPTEVLLIAEAQSQRGNEKSWREHQELLNEKAKLRYHARKTSKRRSRSKSKSLETECNTPPESERNVVYETRSRQNGKKSREGSENVLSGEKSGKRPAGDSQERECKKDGLEKVSDSSEEEYERKKASERYLERKEQKLLQLEMIAKSIFADHIQKDLTNETGTSSPTTNSPPS